MCIIIIITRGPYTLLKIGTVTIQEFWFVIKTFQLSNWFTKIGKRHRVESKYLYSVYIDRLKNFCIPKYFLT